MSDLKKDRIKMLEDCINNIKQVSLLYQKASPAWTLIQNAYAHINSIHHLESKTNFDEETLGVIFKHERMDKS